MVQNSGPAICIVGGGRVGSVLANHFIQSGFTITAIIEKNETKHSHLKKLFLQTAIKTYLTSEIILKSTIIFICVQDDCLSGVVEQLGELSGDFSQKIFVHTSGAHSSSILDLLKEKNGQIASAHPIYSFGSDDPAKVSLKGVYFDLEGGASALTELKKILHKVGVNTIEITEDQKLPIHIASVFFSNYFVGLTQIAQAVLRISKISKENSWKPFLPLIQSTLNNLSSNTHEALTGPIKRGDVLTVNKHLQFLNSNLPEAVPTYIQLARTILELASLPDEIKEKVEVVLAKYNNKIY